MFNRLLFLLAAVFTVTCTPQNQAGLDASEDALAVGLKPAPGQEPTLLDQLKRYRGQTQFLNLEYSGRGMPVAAPSEGRSAEGGGAARAVQESDIFKVGKPGSKLLYLLNNVRGLQVVSFSEGADSPKLLGRVQATGNYPDDMYYDGAGDRLLVLERLWHGDGGYAQEQSRIVVYDVKNPAEPKISEVLPFAGEVYDSRLVGDILYTVGSLRPDNRFDHAAKPKGLVHSFRISRSGVKPVQKLELSLAAVYGDNLNIVTATESGKAKYYLTAVVAEDSWAWFGRQSLVEVVDISNPAGKINSVMVASVKGMVRERSATAIKNRTLIVTSNYMINGTENRQIGRVAVETFTFPEPESEIIDDAEAKFRKMHIERELKGLPAGDAKDRRTEELVADPKLGIKGRFVKSERALQKIMADSSVTVGDTTGLSANLQDVRYEEDLLYVFWVPANQIDPFDLFDISRPEKGIRYIGRLQFDGWIERSIPMTVRGRKFVIGLGYVIPSVNNENRRRVPQVVLFEVENAGGKPRAKELATLTLSEANGWTDFNAGDKFIEVRPSGEGKGEILFQASAFEGGKFVSGGKVIAFDVNEAVNGDSSKIFREGGLLVGDAGWLRRVFTNPEIDRVNTFSDQALGVFAASSLGASTGVVRTTATLELARNLRAYVTLSKGSAMAGIQIISDYSYFGGAGSTELREVNPSRADEELDKALNVLKVEGSYNSHLVARDGALYLFTQDYVQRTSAKEGERNYETHHRVYKLGLGDAGLAQLGSAHWIQAAPPRGLATPRMISASGGLIQLPSGAILVQDGQSLRTLETAATGLAVTEIRMDRSCGQASNGTAFGLDLVSNRLFLLKSIPLKDDTYGSWRMTRNFVSLARLDAKTLKCGREINVPGKLVIATDDYLLTEDDSVLDVITRPMEPVEGGDARIPVPFHEFRTQKAYVSLRMTKKHAALIDQLPLDENSYAQKHELDEKTLAYIENLSGQGGGWMPGRQLPGAEPRLSYISLDDKGFLVQEVHYLQLEITGAGLLGLFADHKSKDYFAIVGNSRQVQVLRLVSTSRAPVVAELVGVDVRFQRTLPTKVISLGGYRYNDAVNFTAPLDSFEISMGLSGVTQFFLNPAR